MSSQSSYLLKTNHWDNILHIGLCSSMIHLKLNCKTVAFNFHILIGRNLLPHWDVISSNISFAAYKDKSNSEVQVKQIFELLRSSIFQGQLSPWETENLINNPIWLFAGSDVMGDAPLDSFCVKDPWKLRVSTTSVARASWTIACHAYFSYVIQTSASKGT